MTAAVAAVLTAGGTMAINKGHDAYERATRAQTVINQTIKGVADAKTEADARDALDTLRLKIDQL